MINGNNSFAFVKIQPNLWTGINSTWVVFNGQSFTISDVSTLSIVRNGNQIHLLNNSSLLSTINNIPDNIFTINVEELGAVFLENNLVSYCNLPISKQYVQLKRKLEGGFYLVPVDDILRVEYNKEYYDALENLNFKIIDKFGELVSLVSNNTNSSIYGDNRIDFNIGSLQSGYYILEISNNKKEVFFLRFKKQ